MSKHKIVAVVGSLGTPSRTGVLARRVTTALTALIEADVHIIEIATVGATLTQSFNRKTLSDEGLATLALVESASILVAASPVYRATYTGLFKHLFDLVGQEALVDVPVILAATGGSDRHSLVIEHAFRPLFGFFRAHTVPAGVYATEADFEGDDISNHELGRRIDIAAHQAVRALVARSSPTHVRAANTVIAV